MMGMVAMDQNYFVLVAFGLFCINWLSIFSLEIPRFLCLVGGMEGGGN